MLTPSIKSKVASLWDKFWSDGISNPLNAIEQITYLLFMKQLEETDINKVNNSDLLNDRHISLFSGKYFPPEVDITDEKNAIEKETLRWSSFTKLTSDEMLMHIQSKVFPFIKQLDDVNSFFTKHISKSQPFPCCNQSAR